MGEVENKYRIDYWFRKIGTYAIVIGVFIIVIGFLCVFVDNNDYFLITFGILIVTIGLIIFVEGKKSEKEYNRSKAERDNSIKQQIDNFINGKGIEINAGEHRYYKINWNNELEYIDVENPKTRMNYDSSLPYPHEKEVIVPICVLNSKQIDFYKNNINEINFYEMTTSGFKLVESVKDESDERLYEFLLEHFMNRGFVFHILTPNYLGSDNIAKQMDLFEEPLRSTYKAKREEYLAEKEKDDELKRKKQEEKNKLENQKKENLEYYVNTFISEREKMYNAKFTKISIFNSTTSESYEGYKSRIRKELIKWSSCYVYNWNINRINNNSNYRLVYHNQSTGTISYDNKTTKEHNSINGYSTKEVEGAIGDLIDQVENGFKTKKSSVSWRNVSKDKKLDWNFYTPRFKDGEVILDTKVSFEFEGHFDNCICIYSVNDDTEKFEKTSFKPSKQQWKKGETINILLKLPMSKVSISKPSKIYTGIRIIVEDEEKTLFAEFELEW